MRRPLAVLTVTGLLAVPAVATAANVSVAGAASSRVPVITNAKNLHKAPVVKPGKKPAPTKLVTKDLVVGTGATAAAGNTVLVKYIGANYANGKDFTNTTWTSGKATSFALTTVIPGFAQGIEGMKVGGRREIVIPWKLGYGAAGSGPIGPKENLVFVVDLKGVS